MERNTLLDGLMYTMAPIDFPLGSRANFPTILDMFLFGLGPFAILGYHPLLIL